MLQREERKTKFSMGFPKLNSILKTEPEPVMENGSLNDIPYYISELTKNSIDAGSTIISIRLCLEKFWIQICDNGIGFSKELMRIIAEKNITDNDRPNSSQQSISRYGEKGEFLKNLNEHVEELIIETLSKSTTKPQVKVFKRGFYSLNDAAVRRSSIIRGAASGSTITCKNLYYNRPTKQRCVDFIATMKKIVSFIRDLAIINHNISFCLRDNNKTRVILSTKITQDIPEQFSSIYHLDNFYFDYICCRKEDITVETYFSSRFHETYDRQYIYLNRNKLAEQELYDFLNNLFDILNKMAPKTIVQPLQNPVYIVCISYPNVKVLDQNQKIYIRNVLRKCMEAFVEKLLLIKRDKRESITKVELDIMESIKTYFRPEEQNSNQQHSRNLHHITSRYRRGERKLLPPESRDIKFKKIVASRSARPTGTKPHKFASRNTQTEQRRTSDAGTRIDDKIIIPSIDKKKLRINLTKPLRTPSKDKNLRFMNNPSIASMEKQDNKSKEEETNPDQLLNEFRKRMEMCQSWVSSINLNQLSPEESTTCQGDGDKVKTVCEIPEKGIKEQINDTFGILKVVKVADTKTLGTPRSKTFCNCLRSNARPIIYQKRQSLNPSRNFNQRRPDTKTKKLLEKRREYSESIKMRNQIRHQSFHRLLKKSFTKSKRKNLSKTKLLQLFISNERAKTKKLKKRLAKIRREKAKLAKSISTQRSKLQIGVSRHILKSKESINNSMQNCVGNPIPNQDNRHPPLCMAVPTYPHPLPNQCDMLMQGDSMRMNNYLQHANTMSNNNFKRASRSISTFAPHCCHCHMKPSNPYVRQFSDRPISRSEVHEISSDPHLNNVHNSGGNGSKSNINYRDETQRREPFFNSALNNYPPYQFVAGQQQNFFNPNRNISFSYSNLNQSSTKQPSQDDHYVHQY